MPLSKEGSETAEDVLRSLDSERTNVGSPEVQRSTTNFGQHMCAPEVGTEGRWQQGCVLHLLQDVPESLGKIR